MGECNPLPKAKSGFQLLSSPLPRVQRSGLLPTDLPSAVLAVLIHNIIKIRINTQYSQAQAVLSDPARNLSGPEASRLPVKPRLPPEHRTG